MKNIFKIIFIGICLFLSYYVTSSTNQEHSDYLFDNIEALASGEGGASGCFNIGTIYCYGVRAEYATHGR